MIKHIFCDLDGTLLKDFYKIQDEDIKALQLAHKKGLTVSIATGRLDYEIKMIMEKYDISGYRISQNGAVVFDELNNLIYEKCLSYQDVMKILDVLNGQNIIVFFQTATTYYVEEKVQLIIDFEKTQPYITYHENKEIRNELDKHQFVTISLWAEKDENIKIKKILDKHLPQHIISYISSQYTIDITCSGNSKGNAIRQISDLNGSNLDEIAVIGDSHNDISMFNVTKFSYVMNEAQDVVKKEANYIVKDVKTAVFDIINK